MERGAPDGTIAARMLLRVVERAVAAGHAADALTDVLGVSLAALSEPGARLPYELAVRLGERALDLTGDVNFGLHLARDVLDSGRYDAGVLLLMASPSLRVALERMVWHQSYWGDGQRSALVPTDGGVIVRYRLAGVIGAYARHVDECAMAEVALGARALSGRSVAPRVVRFRHVAPEDVEEHRDVFGCPLEFRAPETELVFDDATLDLPMLHASEAFSVIFERQVTQAVAGLPASSPMADRVRAAAHAALGSGACSLARTAQALGVSTRTLQRRLRQERTSFAEIVDALRRETALRYLKRGLDIPEIATMLGYSDATAFHHAFARWTGSSPKRHTGDAVRS